jgi:hypothetical protein
MYDVIYIDRDGAETSVAQALPDRADAAALARTVALERDAGRMVLSGPRRPKNCVCVVPLPEQPDDPARN